jgi:hypothetical protein
MSDMVELEMGEEMEASEQIGRIAEVIVKLSPLLSRWIAPKYCGDYALGHELEEDSWLGWLMCQMTWGDGADSVELWIDSKSIQIRRDRHRSIVEVDIDACPSLLPPEFVEFMDTHFKREVAG